MRINSLTTTMLDKISDYVAILPVGATEQHGPHLPLSTDTIIAEYLSLKVEERNNKVLLLPTIPIGNSIEHNGFKGNISFSNITTLHMYNDIFNSIQEWGITRLVICNAHGGNVAILQAIVEEWNRKNTLKVKSYMVSNVNIETKAAEMFGYSEPHAGSVETSLICAILPEEVERIKSKIKEVNKVYAGKFSYYKTRDLSEDGVLNNEKEIKIDILSAKKLLDYMIEGLNDAINKLHNM